MNPVHCGIALTLTLGALACGPAPESPSPPPNAHPSAIINGTPDESPGHNAIGLVGVSLGGTGYVCTGTLISPRIVLTAGHCLNKNGITRVIFGYGPSAAELTWVTASHYNFFPGYDPDIGIGDVALILLNADVAGVQPIPVLPPEFALSDSDLGSELTLIGLGKTAPNDTSSIGNRTLAYTQIGYLCHEATGTCDWDYSETESITAAAGDVCYLMMPGNTCNGDSGGPALVTRNGVEYIAGTTSYGDSSCALYGCNSTLTSPAMVQYLTQAVANATLTNLAPGEICFAKSQCAAATDPCMTVTCTLNGCAQTAVTDGTSCDDGNPCTTQDACTRGVCGGTPRVCPAPACQVATCDPQQGCLAPTPAPEGSPCDDGNACTLNDTCREGVCGGTHDPSCDPKPPPPAPKKSGCSTGGGEFGFLALLGIPPGLLRRRRRRA